MNQFDAVIFHPVYYPDGHVPNQTERTSDQRYVFYIVESPMFGFSNFLLSKDAFLTGLLPIDGTAISGCHTVGSAQSLKTLLLVHPTIEIILTWTSTMEMVNHSLFDTTRHSKALVLT